MSVDTDIDFSDGLDQAEPSSASEGSAGGPSAGGQVAGDAIFTDGKGRRYFKVAGKNVFIRKDETPEQAQERALRGPKDQRPTRKGSRATPKKPPAPTKVELKELEKELAEALCSPAYICGMLGDQWGADHFTSQGPYLARNLIAAADHNPWLKRKLEDWAAGGSGTMALIALLGVGGALIGYAVPPIVYYLNLPAPEMARAMFNIPPRRTGDDDAASPPGAYPFAQAA